MRESYACGQKTSISRIQDTVSHAWLTDPDNFSLTHDDFVSFFVF